MKLKGSCHCQSVQFECISHTPYPYMHCYCSICRKTAGGGGYAINLMASSNSLKIKGKPFIAVYRARLQPHKKSRSPKSTGERNFCKKCGSCLWLYDPTWPDLIHPFASAIDTALPIPPEKVHIMLVFAATWCEIPKGSTNLHFKKYPPLSIEDWHKKHNLRVK